MRTIVIDACCTVNLLATGRAVEIVEALDAILLQTPQANAESLYLWTFPDDEGAQVRERAPIELLTNAGVLRIQAIDDDDLTDAFVELAARIKDADASCIALAGVRGLPLLTDDKKERRLCRETFAPIPILSTLDVLAEAAERLGWSTEVTATCAGGLWYRGNFAPPKRDPRAGWYEELLRSYARPERHRR